jgi:hypothetical protein
LAIIGSQDASDACGRFQDAPKHLWEDLRKILGDQSGTGQTAALEVQTRGDLARRQRIHSPGHQSGAEPGEDVPGPGGRQPRGRTVPGGVHRSQRPVGRSDPCPGPLQKHRGPASTGGPPNRFIATDIASDAINPSGPTHPGNTRDTRDTGGPVRRISLTGPSLDVTLVWRGVADGRREIGEDPGEFTGMGGQQASGVQKPEEFLGMGSESRQRIRIEDRGETQTQRDWDQITGS